MDPEQVAELVESARSGDAEAWDLIIEEFSPLVCSVVRGYRLGDAAAADAVQSTWLRLLEHLDSVRQPARLAGWLRTTSQRACLETLRGSGRERLVDHQGAERLFSSASSRLAREQGPECDVVRREQVALLRVAVAALPPRQRALVDLLTATPALGYREISERLDIPVGSIGPTRARILDRLREGLAASGLYDAVPA
ncbi:MAG: sigma-70 family RNA polymerase sigma factor [Nocardioidaceae bacterium]